MLSKGKGNFNGRYLNYYLGLSCMINNGNECRNIGALENFIFLQKKSTNMKNICVVLLFSYLLIMLGCKSDAGAGKTSDQSTQASADKALARFAELVGTTADVEFIFYSKEGSMTTSIQDPNEIQTFKNFLVPVAVDPEKAKCNQDGGIVFRNGEGKIIIELDYSKKPECKYARLRQDNAYSYLTLSPSGEAFLAKFFQMFTPEGMQQMQEQQTQQQAH